MFLSGADLNQQLDDTYYPQGFISNICYVHTPSNSEIGYLTDWFWYNTNPPSLSLSFSSFLYLLGMNPSPLIIIIMMPRTIIPLLHQLHLNTILLQQVCNFLGFVWLEKNKEKRELFGGLGLVWFRSVKKRGWKSRERGHPDEMSIIWIWDLDFGSRTVVLIGLFFHILPHFAAQLWTPFLSLRFVVFPLISSILFLFLLLPFLSS